MGVGGGGGGGGAHGRNHKKPGPRERVMATGTRGGGERVAAPREEGGQAVGGATRQGAGDGGDARGATPRACSFSPSLAGSQLHSQTLNAFEIPLYHEPACVNTASCISCWIAKTKYYIPVSPPTFFAGRVVATVFLQTWLVVHTFSG